ncbi:MAG: LysR substrate-binding domain-containing protein [Lacisediminimonas sp.]|nr:LysR substrate-binding domain-containing protein [Lacisediminimonas sp.]
MAVSGRLAQLRVRHMMLLDLIAEGGSLSKAAEALAVSQPAVTAMLQELEGVLGVQLVERDRKGARLTTIGAATHARLRQVLNALNGLESGLTMAPKVHHLRVGVLTTAMLELVPDAVAKLRRHGPQTSFQFFEDTVENVVNGVLDGSLDCGIGRIGTGVLQSANSKRLQITQIQKAAMKVVGAPTHPICALDRVKLAALLDYSWILLPRGSQSRAAFDDAFVQQGLVPPLPVVESLSFYSNFHLASKTDLLTIAPSAALEHFAAANIVKAIKIRWPIGLSPFMFFCLKEMSDGAAISAFRTALLAHGRLRKD